MLLVMNEWETSRSYTCVHVLVWAYSRPGCVSLLHFLVRLLSEGHSSPHFHTENVLLRVPWDLQLNSIHLLPLEDDVGGDGGGIASLYLPRARCMCVCLLSDHLFKNVWTFYALLSNISQTGAQHNSGRVTENHCGQNMICCSDSQLLMINASEKRGKYA